jgi:hypothetical protein
MIETRTAPATHDRPCPLAYIGTAAFLSGLVWLWMMLGQVVR